MVSVTDSANICNMATYMQIVIQQARRHPGGGWVAYDQLFWQQRAAGIGLPWNDLAPSIMTATVLQSGDTCSLCHSPDHPTEQCALFTQEGLTRSAAKPSGTQEPNHPSHFKPYTVQSSVSSSRRNVSVFQQGNLPILSQLLPLHTQLFLLQQHRPRCRPPP